MRSNISTKIKNLSRKSFGIYILKFIFAKNRKNE